MDYHIKQKSINSNLMLFNLIEFSSSIKFLSVSPAKSMPLLMACLGMVSCDSENFKNTVVNLAGHTLIEKRIEIYPGQYWYYEFNLDEKGDLYSKFNVTSGPGINIDLLPTSEFTKWQNGHDFLYYKSNRGENILEDEFITELKANTSYVLVVEPNDMAESAIQVAVKVNFIPTQEDKN